MARYNPDTGPVTAEWLKLDEVERVGLVEQYHKEAGIAHPQPKLHATIHTVVENQLAINEATVIETLQRLQQEGLSRHDAVHAIGTVVVEHVMAAFKTKAESGPALTTQYFDRLKQLTADEWRRMA